MFVGFSFSKNLNERHCVINLGAGILVITNHNQSNRIFSQRYLTPFLPSSNLASE